MSIGKRLEEVRKNKGLTQTWVAKQIGITKNHLNRIEHGLSPIGRMRLETALRLASVLNVPVEQLFVCIERGSEA